MLAWVLDFSNVTLTLLWVGLNDWLQRLNCPLHHSLHNLALALAQASLHRAKLPISWSLGRERVSECVWGRAVQWGMRGEQYLLLIPYLLEAELPVPGTLEIKELCNRTSLLLHWLLLFCIGRIIVFMPLWEIHILTHSSILKFVIYFYLKKQ